MIRSYTSTLYERLHETQVRKQEASAYIVVNFYSIPKSNFKFNLN